MLSFQEFQSAIKENIPYYLWEFEQKQSSDNNGEYWAKIKNSRIGVCYLCRLNRFIVILQNNGKIYKDQTTIAASIKFIHDVVVNYIQLGF
uniref:Uncharacterized protein n=1 Tax=Bacteriophage sp. TaxID=38018 RepID=A0A7G9A4G4_9VIRU|nr:MAG: hypothetical protein [Bacteriophage sp.]